MYSLFSPEESVSIALRAKAKTKSDFHERGLQTHALLKPTFSGYIFTEAY